jgi:hypothetical protein
MYAVRPSRCGRGAELAYPCRAALILIIRVPSRPSRLISRRSSLSPQTSQYEKIRDRPMDIAAIYIDPPVTIQKESAAVHVLGHVDPF